MKRFILAMLLGAALLYCFQNSEVVNHEGETYLYIGLNPKAPTILSMKSGTYHLVIHSPTSQKKESNESKQ